MKDFLNNLENAPQVQNTDEVTEQLYKEQVLPFLKREFASIPYDEGMVKAEISGRVHRLWATQHNIFPIPASLLDI